MISDFDLAALSPRLVELAGLKAFWPETPAGPPDDLSRSIAELGLLRPLIIFEESGSLRLLAGRRRRAALLSLGRSQAPALLLPPAWPLERALGAALADNMERGWNEAEKALYWAFLEGRDSDLAARLAPLLGLPPSPKMRQSCLKAASLPDDGLRALAEGRLDLENAARLADWAPGDLAAVLPLFEILAPSKQKKREWLNWLEDLGRREKRSPAEILADPAIENILAETEKHGRPATENRLRRHLWARRHPLLARLGAEREARLRALNLPPAARLDLDPSLEDLSFKLNLSFATLEEFQSLAETLRQLGGNPDLAALMDDGQGENHDF